jgi:hypothetical protein
MTYIVNKTDGTILTTIIEGSVDQTTNLALIGKNVTNFGELFNENLVKILENFSSLTPPERPIEGQLWFDRTEDRIKVYTRTGWKSSGGPIISDVQPLNLSTGDLWIDNREDQLYFFDGTDLVLAGPTWKRSQGKTGLVAETVFDAFGNAKTILNLFVGNLRLGLFAAEEFSPSPPIQGFTNIVRGFNSNTQVAFSFNTTVSNSLALNGLNSTKFLRSDINSTTLGQIFVQNNNGISVGTSQIGQVKVSGTSYILENSLADGDLILRTNNVSGANNALIVDSSTNRIGIYTTTPQATLDIQGSLLVRDNVTISGNETIINSNIVKIRDKSLEIGAVNSPTDALADGGGLILKGTTDKTIIYSNSTESFNISENINLAAGKSISINGVEILSGNTLGSAITSAPGITEFGPQNTIIVGDLELTENKISLTTPGLDIEINANGGNIILVGGSIIKGVSAPFDQTDAVNKEYAETFAKTLPISVVVTSNGIGNAINANIVLLLSDIANPILFADGKVAFVHVETLSIVSDNVNVARTLKRFEIQNGQWVFAANLTSSI